MDAKLKKVLLAVLVAAVGAYFGPEVGTAVSSTVDAVQGVQAGAYILGSGLGVVVDLVTALTKLTK
jgi:hypothetical protein